MGSVDIGAVCGAEIADHDATGPVGVKCCVPSGEEGVVKDNLALRVSAERQERAADGKPLSLDCSNET